MIHSKLQEPTFKYVIFFYQKLYISWVIGLIPFKLAQI